MRPIPDKIKAEVVKRYLEGYSIPQISKSCGVSHGTVHSITTEESHKDESIIYIREITKIFRKNNLEISDVIAGVRLYNKVKEVGLSCLFFENFLESTNTESFRIGMDHDQFLENIKIILKLEEQYQIKVEEIPSFINKKMDEYKNLENEYNNLEEIIDKLYSRYNVTKAEIEDYKKEENMFLQYKRDYPKYIDWIVPERLFEEAYITIGKKFDSAILFKKLKAIYTKPNENTDIIKKILNMD